MSICRLTPDLFISSDGTNLVRMGLMQTLIGEHSANLYSSSSVFTFNIVTREVVADGTMMMGVRERWSGVSNKQTDNVVWSKQQTNKQTNRYGCQENIKAKSRV